MATIIVPLYGLLNKKLPVSLKLSAIAKAQRLTFSSVSKIGSYVIAIDSIRKKLLYFKNKNQAKSCVIIDLKHVSECSIRKQYDPIEAGALGSSNLSDFLKSISMIFHFRKFQRSVSIPLLETGTDSIADLQEMEYRVKSCAMAISKLLPRQINERA